MARCRSCGVTIGNAMEYCASCSVMARNAQMVLGESPEEQEQERYEDKKAAAVPTLKCHCGKPAVRGVDLCEECYRDAPRINPQGKIYIGLATTSPNGRYVCDAIVKDERCNGTIRPVITFTGDSYWKCRKCGDIYAHEPRELEPYKNMSPAELKRFLANRSIERLEPPMAIQHYRKSQGRDPLTGRKLGSA